MAAKQQVQKQAKPQKKGTKSNNRIIRYFQETRDELRKVTWPDRDETSRLTLIVLVATLAFSVSLGGLDGLFQFLVGLLI